MKNLILGLGRFFVDLGSFIQLLIVIALSITAGVAAGSLVGILTFLALFTIFILSNYLFCLILGMHDSQVSIARSLEMIAKNFVYQSEQNKQITQVPVAQPVVRKCPSCGAKFNTGDTFCGECGNKLNE